MVQMAEKRQTLLAHGGRARKSEIRVTAGLGSGEEDFQVAKYRLLVMSSHAKREQAGFWGLLWGC
jgi:hypothetical protein